MMALQVHLMIASDLTPNQAFESDNGILHASSLDVPVITLQYWITTRSILPTFTQDQQEAGYKVLYFTPFLTKAAWECLYPDQPAANTISARLAETAPLTIPSLSSLVSTSPTPTKHPTHNYLQNAPSDPTPSFIALIHQTLQQKLTMMAHLQTQSSPPLVQTTPIAPAYKPQRSPFPKLDGVPPTAPLFLAQVVT